jgi:hypothetical protein
MASQAAQDGRVRFEVYDRTQSPPYDNSRLLFMCRYTLSSCLFCVEIPLSRDSYFQLYRSLSSSHVRNSNRAYVYDPKFTMVGDHKSLPRQLCARSKVVNLPCLQTPSGDVCSIGSHQPLHAYFRPAFSEVTEKAD